MDFRKTIYTVLDILLILGALINIMTINGGDWNALNAESGPQMSTDCMLSPAPIIPEIAEADAILTTSGFCNPNNQAREISIDR